MLKVSLINVLVRFLFFLRGLRRLYCGPLFSVTVISAGASVHKKRKGFFVKASGTYLTRAIGPYAYYKDSWCVIFVVSYLCAVPSEFACVLCSRCATLSASEL